MIGLMAVGIAITAGASLARAAVMAGLIDTVVTDGWAPQAPIDPSGVAYVDGSLIVVDCNIDELDEYQDVNLWEYSLATGAIVDTGNTHSAADYESLEPTGVDYDASGQILYLSEDSSNTVWGIQAGGDGRLGTSDDTVVHEFDIGAMGAWDTEDPAWDPASGHLFVLNGGGSEIFEVDPSTGEKVGEIDLASIIPGVPADFEGLTIDPDTGHLLAGARVEKVIYEVTTSGALVDTIDASGIPGLVYISGMTMAPSSTQPGEWSIWISDRDSDALFEISASGTGTTTTTTSTTLASTTTTQSSTTTTNGTTSSTGAGTTTTTTTTTNPPDPTPDPGDPFVDNDGHVFEEAITWLAAQGITQGCNPPVNDRFCPNARVTRGEMAAFLTRAQHLPAYSGPDRFRDDDGSVFEGAVERLAEAGITQGCNPPANNRFCPDRQITRGEMAAFLVRAFGLGSGGPGNHFLDDDGHIFESAIDRLRNAGITQGCNPPANNRYCPDEYVTRGQMAAFLKRAIEG